MARGWYGLYFGDRVQYGSMGHRIEGTIIKLFASDKNGGIMIDDSGNEHKVVCEFCTRIPTSGLLTFRPLSDMLYTTLVFEDNDNYEVYCFPGDELEDMITRIIDNVGDEINKIEIYTREGATHHLSKYQSISSSDFHHPQNLKK